MSFAVFASAKSGTTWIQRLLSAHPQVHCAESRAFGQYFDPKNPTAIHITIDSFVDNLRAYYHPPAGAGDDLYDDMLYAIVDAIATTTLAHAGKRIYGEKITPYWGTGSQVVDRLAAYSPHLHLVHLVRDPRDVVVSGFVHQANIRIGSGHPRADHYRACLDEQRIDDEIMESSLSLWMDSNGAALSAEGRFERVLLLRYEDLLAETSSQITRLLDFIGADADPAMVEHCVSSASFKSLSGGRREGEEDRSSFFRKGVAGDWRHWLTGAQESIITDRAGGLMQRLGYAPGAGA